MIASKTKFKSTGDLRSPSSSMSTIKSSVQSVNNHNNNINRTHNSRNNDGRDRNIRNRNTKQQYPKRPPLNPAAHNKTDNLKREYKIRQSQTLLLLITTTISFFLFLLFTLPFYALLGLTMMITFFGLGIVVATSAIKTRYLLELEHPLGLLRYLPQKVRVPLTEKSLHDCLISPSTSLNSLKSLSGGGGGDDSKKSSKNSLSSLGNRSGSNHSSMESLASYNNHNGSSNSLNQSRRGSSRPSLLPPPPPPPDRSDSELKTANSSEFSSGEFDMVRQATLKRGNKASTNLNQQQKENSSEQNRKRGGIKSDRYSIYQTNERVIR